MDSIENRIDKKSSFDNVELVAILEETAEIREKLLKYSENKEIVSNIYENIIQREDHNKDYSSELTDFFEIIKDGHILGNIYLNLNEKEKEQLLIKTQEYLSYKTLEAQENFIYSIREPYFLREILTKRLKEKLNISFILSREKLIKTNFNNQNEIIKCYNFWDISATLKQTELEDQRRVFMSVFPELYKRTIDAHTQLL